MSEKPPSKHPKQETVQLHCTKQDFLQHSHDHALLQLMSGQHYHMMLLLYKNRLSVKLLAVLSPVPLAGCGQNQHRVTCGACTHAATVLHGSQDQGVAAHSQLLSTVPLMSSCGSARASGVTWTRHHSLVCCPSGWRHCQQIWEPSLASLPKAPLARQ